MKKHLVSITTILALCIAASEISAQNCGYQMDRRHANYFAAGVGYNGQGFLPSLEVADIQRRLKGDWYDYYNNQVPICDYCRKSSVLAGYGNSLALCNAYNYYYNTMIAEYNGSIRFMDREIESMRIRGY
ncbi:MAG: hypothetical protein R2830_20180 [Saprospiraceae bacterium]